MNKLELIQEVKERCDLTKEEAADVVGIFFSEMTDAFLEGQRVEINCPPNL